MFKDKLKHLWTRQSIRISTISAASVFIIAVLTGSILVAHSGSNNEAFNGEIIRLHVLANSDSDEDQSLKLKVRDAVLKAAGEEIKNAGDITSVKEEIATELDTLKYAAENVIKQEGYNYDIDVQWGIFPFPEKTYGNATFPAGNYRAVRVIIGSGEGHNWWCVMFPPLCFVDETHAQMPESSLSKLSTNTKDIITDEKPKYTLKFKIVEMFKNNQ